MNCYLSELFLLRQWAVIFIYSTDFKYEAKLKGKNILHTAHRLIESRTHPLIHLQLEFPFLKPQSAEQCLQELSSALETALGTGGSCWFICGRGLLLQVNTRNSGEDCESVAPLRCFLCRALGVCLVHRQYDQKSTWVLLGLVCLKKLERNAGETSYYILLEPKWERLCILPGFAEKIKEDQSVIKTCTK